MDQAEAYLITYDMRSRQSSDDSISYLQEIERQKRDGPIAVVVVATHQDFSPERVVSTAEGQAFAVTCGQHHHCCEAYSEDKPRCHDAIIAAIRLYRTANNLSAVAPKSKDKSVIQ